MRAMTSRWPVTLTFALFALLAGHIDGQIGPTQPAPTTSTTEGPITHSWCANDLLFLIDCSASVGQTEFEFLKSLVLSLIENEIVSDECTRVGLISYSDNVYSMVGGFTGNITFLRQAIDTLPYQGLGTYTHLAFRAASRIFQQYGRVDVLRSVVIITDGFSILPLSSRDAARELRVDEKANVYAVPVVDNDQFLHSELRAYTGGNVSRVVQVESFSNITTYIDFGIREPNVTVSVSVPPATPSSTELTDTSTPAIDATSTPAIDATSTPAIDATSTTAVDVTSSFSADLDSTSTGAIDALSSTAVDLTSTGVLDATSTDFGDLDFTSVIDSTSTEVLNPSSTDDVFDFSSADLVDSSAIVSSDSIASFFVDSSVSSSTDVVDSSSTSSEIIVPSATSSIESLSTDFIVSSAVDGFASSSSSGDVIAPSATDFFDASTEIIDPSSTGLIDSISTDFTDASVTDFIDSFLSSLADSSGASFAESSSSDAIQPTATDLFDSSATDFVDSFFSSLADSSSAGFDSTHSTDVVNPASTDLGDLPATVSSVDSFALSSADVVDSTEVVAPSPASSAESVSIDLVVSSAVDSFESSSLSDVIGPVTDLIDATSTDIIAPSPTSSTDSISTDSIDSSAADFIDSFFSSLAESSSVDFDSTHSTDVINPTSIDLFGISSSRFVDASSDGFVASTSAELINPTSIDLFDSSSVEFDSTHSTDLINPTSTDIVDTSATIVVDSFFSNLADSSSAATSVDSSSTDVIDPTTTDPASSSLVGLDSTSTDGLDSTSTFSVNIISSRAVDSSFISASIQPSSISESSESEPAPRVESSSFDFSSNFQSSSGSSFTVSSKEQSSSGSSFTMSSEVPPTSEVLSTELPSSAIQDVSPSVLVSTPVPDISSSDVISLAPSATATPPLLSSPISVDDSSVLPSVSVSETSVPISPSPTVIIPSSTVLCDDHDQDPHNDCDKDADEDDDNFMDHGDYSVLFNSSSIVAGLCRYAAANMGFGYVPVPHDSTKYIQCHLADNGQVKAAIRQCPRGLYFQIQTQSCVEPENRLDHKEDMCAHKFPGYTTKMDGGCDLYWECDEEGVARPGKCGKYHAYFEKTGCLYTEECQDSDKPICGSTEFCTNKPSANGLGYYTYIFGGYISVYQPCLGETKFDFASCDCQLPPYMGAACRWSSRISLPGETNHSDGSCHLTPGTLAPLTIRFKYKRSSHLNITEQCREEILLHSHFCKDSGILIVSESLNALHVRIFTRRGQVLNVAMPLKRFPASPWRTVTLRYTEGNMRLVLRVPGLAYSVFMRGGLPVSVGMCGWLSGTPGTLQHVFAPFSGQMKQVMVSRC